MPKRARVPPSLAHMATLLTVIPGRLWTPLTCKPAVFWFGWMMPQG
jgi:hypothetical protein